MRLTGAKGQRPGGWPGGRGPAGGEVGEPVITPPLFEKLQLPESVKVPRLPLAVLICTRTSPQASEALGLPSVTVATVPVTAEIELHDQGPPKVACDASPT